jgi:hypothetical protein
VVEYPSWDLPDGLVEDVKEAARRVGAETGWNYDHHLSEAPGMKVGGYPSWNQLPDWPVCACGHRMTHLRSCPAGSASLRGPGRRWTRHVLHLDVLHRRPTSDRIGQPAMMPPAPVDRSETSRRNA